MTVEDPTNIDDAGIAWIQDRIREILAELKRVSSNTGFDYFLAYGTALGAVRDGDIIRWDPDADVFLPINRYDEIVSILSRELSTKYEVLHPGLAAYEHLFARLAIRGIDHKIIRVDLFPLCSAPVSRTERYFFTKCQRLLALAFMIKRVNLESKSHYSRGKRSLAIVLRSLLSILPASAVERSYRYLVRNRDIDESSHALVNPQGAYGAREFFDATWFTRSRLAMIGGTAHPVPIGVEAFLEQLYGKYEDPIPPAQVTLDLEFITKHYVDPLRAEGWPLPPRSHP